MPAIAATLTFSFHISSNWVACRLRASPIRRHGQLLQAVRSCCAGSQAWPAPCMLTPSNYSLRYEQFTGETVRSLRQKI